VPLALALRTTILHCGVRRKGSLHTAQRTKTLPVAETTARVDAQGGSLCTAELGLLRHTGTAVKLLPQRRAQTRESLGRCLLPGKGIFFFSKDPNWQSIAPNGGFRVLPPVFSLRQFSGAPAFHNNMDYSVGLAQAARCVPRLCSSCWCRGQLACHICEPG